MNARCPFSPMPSRQSFGLGCLKLLSIESAEFIQILRRAIHFVKRQQTDFLNEVFSEVTTEGGCVLDRQSYVFVQVEALHPIPGNAFYAGESFESV